MSTRANVLVINPNKSVIQYYHHHDGYPTFLGNELRNYILTSLGLQVITKKDLGRIFQQEIQNNEYYEKEDEYNIKDKNNLHGDIEYIHVVDLAQLMSYDTVNLFIKNKYELQTETKGLTIIEILELVCSKETKIDLTKKITKK